MGKGDDFLQKKRKIERYWLRIDFDNWIKESINDLPLKSKDLEIQLYEIDRKIESWDK